MAFFALLCLTGAFQILAHHGSKSQKLQMIFQKHLVDGLYRQKHGLTVTGSYSMGDLVDQERMHPAIVRRLDDMCKVIEV